MPEPQLLYAGTIATRTAWHLSAHQHQHHELVVLIEGRMRLHIDGELVVAAAGDALFYAAGQRHAESSFAEMPFHTYFIGFADTAITAGELPVRVTDQAGRLRQLIRWLYDEHSSSAPPAAAKSAGVCDAFHCALLAEFRRLSGDNTPPLLREVRSYLSTRLADTIVVDDLAAHVGMSKYHFIRTYRKLAGCTPMTAVRQLRAEAAHSLILTTDLPFKQIAAHCGLGNAQHFSRVFAACFGKPPGKIRRITDSDNA